MIEFRAHGKLFVAGEYAVVEPGQPSVLIALDRAITAKVREGHGAVYLLRPDGYVAYRGTPDGAAAILGEGGWGP